jgi:hypothetical protein
MEFFNPSVTFKGTVKADNAPINDTDLTRKQDIAGLSFITGIASGSSSMLSVADGELSLSNIAITDVHVDSTQTSLANFISNEGATAASLREGDVLILTAPSSGTETYIVSGANGSSAANYTQIESPLTAAEVGGVLQAGDGITVNAATAQISANIAAGAGLSSSVSSGQITLALSADSDDINEGSSNLYFTQARARQSIQADPASGNLLSYANASGDMLVSTASVRGVFSAGAGLSFSGGQYSFSGNTDIVGEGSSNLYFTQARARASISAGTGIAYTSGTGEIAINLVGGTAIGVSGNTISFNGSTSDVSEGTNQYFTQARARQSIQADPASGNLLSYANASGDMLVSTASVRGVFSAGTGLTLSNGQYSFSGDSDIVGEGSSNLYFTQARARQSIQADPASGNLLSYANASGDMLVSTASVRGVFSAGTGLSFSGGQFALNATTNNVAEGTNLYYTDARVRAAVTTSSQSDELINYDSSNGTFSLRLQDIRHETSVTLTANVAATISHNLGKRLVHVSAMDSGGALVQLAVSYTNTNSLTVTSAVGVTVTVAISL